MTQLLQSRFAALCEEFHCVFENAIVCAVECLLWMKVVWHLGGNVFFKEVLSGFGREKMIIWSDFFLKIETHGFAHPLTRKMNQKRTTTTLPQKSERMQKDYGPIQRSLR